MNYLAGLAFGLSESIVGIYIWLFSSLTNGWGILPICAGFSSFLIGAFLWGRYADKFATVPYRRAAIIGVLVGLLSHPLCWYLMFLWGYLATFTGFHNAAHDGTPINPLEALQATVMFSAISIFFFGVVTVSIGIIVGIILAKFRLFQTSAASDQSESAVGDKQMVDEKNLILRKLEPSDEGAFLRGFDTWYGEDPDWYSFDYRPGMNYSDLLKILKATELLKDNSTGRVPATMLYGFVKGKIVGRVSIRHYLNDKLLQRGGHIGWAVAPAFRRRGYALAMVKQALPLMRDLGIGRALITCSVTNNASKRILAILGATLENTVEDEGELVERYWLDLRPDLA